MSAYRQQLSEHIAATQLQLQKLTAASARLSNYRLLTMTALPVTLFFGYRKHVYFYAFSIMALTLFVLLVLKHNRLRQKQSFLRISIEIGEKYLARFGKDWEKETTTERAEEKSAQAQDLNIFGSASLHQFIDQTMLPDGQLRLQAWLQNPLTAETNIRLRQDAVKDLSRDLSLLLRIQTLLRFNYKQTTALSARQEELLAPLENRLKSVSDAPLCMILNLLLVFLTLLAVIFKFLLSAPPLFLNTALSLLLGGQILVAFSNLKKRESIILLAENLLARFSPYLKLNKTIIEAPFSASMLCETQDIARTLSLEIKRLQTCSTLASYRHQGIAWFFFNSLLQLDYFIVYLLKKWQKTGSANTRKFIDKMAELEALISITTPAIVREVTYPEIKTAATSPHLTATALKHPLLPPKIAVGNDFNWKNGIKIITGSNMSGKSTFLKTVGINALLAQIGAPVTAASFSFTPMKIYTSMDIHDNLSEGVSTFYEEILRIKTIVEANQDRKTMLVLIDEIFKGTNSQDRLLGAVTLLKQLNQPWSLVLVSTHDLEICDLAEESDQIENFHFTETFTADKVSFDYKLYPGRSTHKNARRLLALAGVILPEENS